jgi:hypothetical protein
MDRDDLFYAKGAEDLPQRAQRSQREESSTGILKKQREAEQETIKSKKEYHPRTLKKASTRQVRWNDSYLDPSGTRQEPVRKGVRRRKRPKAKGERLK